MENIFTPEEANKPVTYGELATILQAVMGELAKNSINDVDTLQDGTFKVIKKLTDSIVQVRDDANYNRQRDFRFIVNLIAQIGHYDKDVIYAEYQRWCGEFDKLNKPQKGKEKKDE